MWNSKHKVQLNDGPKFGFTNIYATAKYKFNAGKVNIYPFLQLGLGVSNVDDFELISREEGISEKDKFEFNSGAYYGIGVGAEYPNVVLELLYGSLPTEPYLSSFELIGATDLNFGSVAIGAEILEDISA